MSSFVYVDFYNLMFRNAYTAGKTADIDEKIGMMMHRLMTSLLYVRKKFGAEHIIICCDDGSWRKAIYPKYKLNRETQRLKKTIKEQEEDAKIIEAAKDFFEFFRNKTYLPCVKTKNAEADDIIGTMIHDNPESNHIIMSTDTDFYQLVSKNVTVYDPTSKKYLMLGGVYDDDLNPMLDKDGKPKIMGDPEWVLFKKCIRGDTSDNITTAYPRVREKGTKNTVGLLECFADREDQKYEWMVIMEHEWTDGFGNKHLVKDLFERNKLLIDLKRTPENIRDDIRMDMLSQFSKKDHINAQNIWFGFMKFCSKWELVRISEQSEHYMNIIA